MNQMVVTKGELGKVQVLPRFESFCYGLKMNILDYNGLMIGVRVNNQVQFVEVWMLPRLKAERIC